MTLKQPQNKHEIKRINTYNDNRFSPIALNQHGCFLVDNQPYEITILSDYEAVINGPDPTVYLAVIEEFLFYTPHITVFFNKNGSKIVEYPRLPLIWIHLDQIQPSQFFVDQDKVNAIRTFIHQKEDIIIPVTQSDERYISLDGHTRLYYAHLMGWKCVRCVVIPSDDWVYDFVREAKKRGIVSPKDLILISHDQYEEKWNRFCEQFFQQKTSDQK